MFGNRPHIFQCCNCVNHDKAISLIPLFHREISGCLDHIGCELTPLRLPKTEKCSLMDSVILPNRAG